MNNIKYRNLDLIYSNLTISYLGNNEKDMQAYYYKFQSEYPEYFGQMDSCVRCVFFENNCMPGSRTSIYSITGDTLRFNIKGCLRAIKRVLDEHNQHSFSLGAIQAIYYSENQFVGTDILYKAESIVTSPISTSLIQPQAKQILTVNDLLSVTDYSIKILAAINPDEETQDISDAITILRGIDLALHNKEADKPLNKSLHTVNNVLTSVVKNSLKTKEDKQFVGAMEILIDLTIDFFCKK